MRKVLYELKKRRLYAFEFLPFIKFKTILKEESLHDDDPLKKRV
jgi:hypothetical protein